MPSLERRVRRRRRGSGCLSAMIVLLILVAAALALILINSNPLQPDSTPARLPFEYPENPSFDAQATTAPLVLGGDSTPEGSAAPAATPAPAQTDAAPDAQSTAQPQAEAGNRLIPAARNEDYFLPVFDRALRTPDDEAMIAVTIDDCNQPEPMTAIMEIARKYDAQFTLFPTGEALMTEGMTEGFRTCVKKLGFELENHSYGHKAEYRITSSELAIQLWKQSIAADYAVGADYEQHFYRPYNNASVNDQRTHFYIGKLGYLGVAGYSHSYKDFKTVEDLLHTLENGKIYQFDMTDASMQMFETFVATASSKGYRLVTMNELFDLNQDVIGRDLTIDQQTLITMEDYVPTYYDLKLNDRTNAVYALQSRLMDLGYLSNVDAQGQIVYADGIYGADTSIAVSEFQARVGILADGNATAETQQALFALNAPPKG